MAAACQGSSTCSSLLKAAGDKLDAGDVVEEDVEAPCGSRASRPRRIEPPPCSSERRRMRSTISSGRAASSMKRAQSLSSGKGPAFGMAERAGVFAVRQQSLNVVERRSVSVLSVEVVVMLPRHSLLPMIRCSSSNAVA